MNVVVTGSNGYLGKYICEQFLKNGHQVIKFQKKAIGEDSIKYDLREEPNYNFENIDVFVHCAYDFKLKSKNQIKKYNIENSIKIINKAIDCGVKNIFFISSLSSFSKAQSIYGQSKFKIEESLKLKNVYILRPGLLIDEEIGGIALSIKKILNIFPIVLYPNSKKKLFLCERKMVFNVINKIILKRLEIKAPITISNEKPYTMHDFLKLISNLNKNKFVFLIPAPVILFIILFKIIKFFKIKLRVSEDNLVSFTNSDQKPDFKLLKDILS